MTARELTGFVMNDCLQHYYWELVVVLRKVLLICIAVFLQRFGLQLQVWGGCCSMQ